MSKTLAFDNDLYQQDSVARAAADYAKLAKIDLKADSAKQICTLSDCIYDETLTAMEFSNYVLLLSLKNHDIS